MASGNTAKDGSGTYYCLLVDSSGQLIVKPAALTATQVTADGNIKASAGTLFGLVVAGAGVTAGDTVTIKNGSGGSTLLTVVFGAANETIVLTGLNITCSSAIYADVTITGGSVYVTGIYA